MTYENLVFEGGGVKGIAYAGAIKALDELCILPGIRRVAGTSSGAITAAILALGADSRTVLEITNRTDYRKFMDDSAGVLRDIIRLIRRNGWHRGDAFTDWFRGIMKDLGVSPDVTFRDLRIVQNNYPANFRDLHVIGTNLDKCQPVVFSVRETPAMPIWQAVRISMSIPFYFTSIQSDGDTWADGGLAWNYPIDVFDAPPYCDTGFNQATLGFSLKSSGHAVQSGGKINNCLDYIRVTVAFFLEQANRQHVKSRDECRTVFLDTGTIQATDFDLTPKQRQRLIENGYRGTMARLESMGYCGNIPDRVQSLV